MKDIDFDKQHLAFRSGEYEISIRSINDVSPFCDCEISIGSGPMGNAVLIEIVRNQQLPKILWLNRIDGGYYLHLKAKPDESQSVKIWDDTLILSLGFTLVSINMDTLTLNWKIRPDLFEIFGFWDLQDDILLRGELEIHRINKDGQVIWSYGGRDIWVNMDGKPEVTILSDKIRLFDFESNEYIIDYNGKTLEDIPRSLARDIESIKVQPTTKKGWWPFW